MSSRLISRCIILFAAFTISASAQLVYQLDTIPPTKLNPGSTISFPNTVVGNQVDFVLRITNSGTANVTVTTITVNGAGFRLSGGPVLLPTILVPTGSATVTVAFAPTQAGPANGNILINSDTLLLSGVGLASPFVFSYVTAGTTITLSASNNSVVFSPVAIGQTAQLSFDVKNAGIAPLVISNIGIGQTSSPYSVSGLPALPVNLAPGFDIQFTIIFQPNTLGFSNGTLQIDTTAISLIASGTQPPSLPSYTIGGVSGQVAPRSQPRISLTLGSPYPVTLAGILTLSTSGNLPSDPAVQFSSGGRTVSFVIPANTTSAVFAGSGTGIAFQTGTVASTITLTPSFATQAGQIDLTPKTPTTLQLTVVSALPTLVGIQLTSQTTNGFSIVVTGFTTTRTLTTWSVQFTTLSGFTMSPSQFTIDVTQIGAVWFQSNASQTFGGQFTVTVPFTFQGTLPSGASVLSGLASVSVNVNNELGSSNTVQAKLQ
jgi:hypothetical protein